MVALAAGAMLAPRSPLSSADIQGALYGRGPVSQAQLLGGDIQGIIEARRRLGVGDSDALGTFLKRAFGATESALVGWFSGFNDRTAKFDDWHDYVNPWEIVQSLGAGFSEIPSAVSKGITFQQRIEETHDPNSWLARHSKPIGLTMSFLFDPINYVSFGATTGSKIAVQRLIAREIETNIDKAKKLIAGGEINPWTNRPWREGDFMNAYVYSKLIRGSPWTPGDALSVLRQSGTLVKQEARRALPRNIARTIPGVRQMIEPATYTGATMKNIDQAPQRITLGESVGAILAPTAVMGGRGIRFAGMEIPGTPEAGAFLGRAIRRTGEQRLGTTSMRLEAGAKVAHQDVGKFLAEIMPLHQLRALADDEIRAMALVDFQHMIDTMKTAHVTAEKAALKTTKAGKGRFTTVAERKRAIDPFVELGELGQKEIAFRRGFQEHKLRIERTAQKAGIKSEVVRSMWIQAMKNNAGDPATALSEYQWRVGSIYYKNQLTRRILENPLFARRVDDKAKVSTAQVWRTEDIPSDYWRKSFGKKTYAVRKEIYSALEEISSDEALTMQMGAFLKLLRYPQDLWKIPATVMNPSFHAMNFVGAVWNNLLAGIFNPIDYVRALAVVYNSRTEAAAMAGRRMISKGGRVPESTEKTRAALALVEEAERRGGLGRTGFIFSETAVGQPIGRSFEEAATSERTLPERIAGVRPTETVRIPGIGEPLGRAGPAVRAGARVARRGAGVAVAATGNPLAIAFFLPETARIGRQTAGFIEDVVRLAPFMKYANEPQIKRALEFFGPIRIPGLKNHDRFTKKDQEIMYDIGAAVARHFQFDYTNLTHHERIFAKTIFPFWTYYKKNFMLQMTQLMKQPRNVNMSMEAMAYIDAEGVDLGPAEVLLPSYFDDIQAFDVSIFFPDAVRKKLDLPLGQPLFLNPKLPFIAAMSLVPPVWNLMIDDGTPFWQRAASVMKPALGSVGPAALFGTKTLVEAITGWQFGLSRPLDYQRALSNDWRNAFIEAPGWVKYLPEPIANWFTFEDKNGVRRMSATAKYVLDTMSTPFISNTGQSIPIGTRSEEAMADRISWLTGIRLIPFDVLKSSRAMGYRMKEILESRQAELREQGKELELHDQETLDYLRYLMKNIEYTWDIREGELDQ